MTARVLLLGTWNTKRDELDFLAQCLTELGLVVDPCDLSLRSAGGSGPVAQKLDLMAQSVQAGVSQVTSHLDGAVAVIGLGGGTGGEIILQIMRDLPMAFPKLLVTTLPFDPRAALADNAITIIPTLADIAGLNTSLRQILSNAAAMVAGLAHRPPPEDQPNPAIAVSALGVTQGACDNLLAELRALNQETMVFHANGYGGAAMARFAQTGAFGGVIDMTVHEITRIHVAGAYTAMPNRFACAPDLARVVLPGGLNFLGLGALDQLPETYLSRPYYRHSGYFTHVQISESEARAATSALCGALQACTGPVTVLLPMGGFSSEDRPGGAIEAPHIRACIAETFEAHAGAFSVARLPFHINEPQTAQAAVAALRPHLQELP